MARQRQPSCTIGHRRHRAHLTFAASLLLLTSFCAVLFFLPPGGRSFYPGCPIWQYTGLLCPGCGATRAAAALVHGHFGEAIQSNGLFVSLLPVLAVYCVSAYARAIWSERTEVWPMIPRWLGIVLLGIASVFAVIRNLA